jgi:hypothetical protein
MKDDVKDNLAPEEAPPGGIKGLPFCWAFLAYSLAVLVLLFAAGIIINPRAAFPFAIFEPVVTNSRENKASLLMSRDFEISGLILGSSRFFFVDMDELNRLTGLKIFNLGVSSAHAEDFYALTRFCLEEAGVKPRLIILGLDDTSFSNRYIDDGLFDFRHRLFRYLDREHVPSFLFFRRLAPILDINYFVDCYKSVQYYFKEDKSKDLVFDKYGYYRYPKKDRHIREGTYNLAGEMVSSSPQYLELYKGLQGLSPVRKRYFERFLGLCDKNNIRLIIFSTPVHDEAIGQINRSSGNFDAIHQELLAYLWSLRGRHRFEYYDFSRTAYFNGSLQEYYDGIHATRKNMSRILNIIFRGKP